jgi:hypothetical protein
MSEYACTNCEEEWNLDPEYDEEGNPFCCSECMTEYANEVPIIILNPENKNETHKES